MAKIVKKSGVVSLQFRHERSVSVFCAPHCDVTIDSRAVGCNGIETFVEPKQAIRFLRAAADMIERNLGHGE